MQKMIDYGIKNKIYEETDNTFKELKRFHKFLYRNFKDYENYDMRLVSNQLVKLYGTSKTHKCDNL